jgi:hypothetical protein
MIQNQPIKLNVKHSAYNPTIDTTISQIIIKGYSNFDPYLGVTVLTSLINPSGKLIADVQAKITGSVWQNWGPSTGRQQDLEYIQSGVLSYLGLSAS